MAMSDPIADMLTRIRNAGKAKFNRLDIPGSRLKTEIAKVLMEEGFIRNYKNMMTGRPSQSLVLSVLVNRAEGHM